VAEEVEAKYGATLRVHTHVEDNSSREKRHENGVQSAERKERGEISKTDTNKAIAGGDADCTLTPTVVLTLLILLTLLTLLTLLQVAKVDCTLNPGTCTKEGIKGYPSIIFYAKVIMLYVILLTSLGSIGLVRLVGLVRVHTRRV
jgi:hypothetical protein